MHKIIRNKVLKFLLLFILIMINFSLSLDIVNASISSKCDLTYSVIDDVKFVNAELSCSSCIGEVGEKDVKGMSDYARSTVDKVLDVEHAAFRRVLYCTKFPDDEHPYVKYTIVVDHHQQDIVYDIYDYYNDGVCGAKKLDGDRNDYLRLTPYSEEEINNIITKSAECPVSYGQYVYCDISSFNDFVLSHNSKDSVIFNICCNIAYQLSCNVDFIELDKYVFVDSPVYEDGKHYYWLDNVTKADGSMDRKLYVYIDEFNRVYLYLEFRN